MESAEREAEPSFGRAEVYLERYLTWPRHIEMQVFADRHGNGRLARRARLLLRSAGTRSSSRRRPAPDFPEDGARRRWARRRSSVGRGLRLRGRRNGRVPLRGRRVLLPRDEHPPAGRAPRHRARDRARPRRAAAAGGGGRADRARPGRRRARRGHAIECRINAEDPAGGTFLPSPGHDHRASRCRPASGSAPTPATRAGDAVSQYYDNLVAKVVDLGRRPRDGTAPHARALAETKVEGVADDDPGATWRSSRTPTSSPPRHSTRGSRSGSTCPALPSPPAAEPAPTARTAGRVLRDVDAEVDGRRYRGAGSGCPTWRRGHAGGRGGAGAATRRTRRRVSPRHPSARRRDDHRPDAGNDRQGARRRGRQRRGGQTRLRPRGDEDGEPDPHADEPAR